MRSGDAEAVGKDQEERCRECLSLSQCQLLQVWTHRQASPPRVQSSPQPLVPVPNPSEQMPRPEPLMRRAQSIRAAGPSIQPRVPPSPHIRWPVGRAKSQCPLSARGTVRPWPHFPDLRVWKDCGHRTKKISGRLYSHRDLGLGVSSVALSAVS